MRGNLSGVDQEPSFPSQFQKKTLWKAVTGLAILVIGALLVGLIWLTSSVLGYLQPVLIPLAVSGIVAYLLDPVVQWLQGKGLSRIKGIVIVFSTFVLFFGLLFSIVGIKLSGQIKNVLNKDSGSSMGWMEVDTLKESKENSLYGWIMQTSFQKDPEAVQKRLQNGGSLTGPQKSKWQLDANTGKLINDDGKNPSPQLSELFDSNWNNRIELPGETNAQELIALENFGVTKGGQWLSNLGEKSLGWLSNSSGKILGFLGLIIGFAMIPVYLYYFLKESQGIKDGWTDYVPLRASHFKDEVVKTLREINGYLISFFRGQVLVAFIDGILVGIALTVFGLPYGLLIGVFMAFLGIIPYIGNILCLIPACIIAYFHGGSEPFGLPQWGYVTGVLAIFIVVQQINSLVTAPKIVGDSVGLHPITVIFSMLFWSLILGGFLGALLAVPMTAAVKVLFRRYVWDRKVLETAQ
ncbi:MAG: AI-2E family transporter [Akkermansiaceae bacterium]|nr:AI-2E family transporter [Akkermansiaceae bacterium]